MIKTKLYRQTLSVRLLGLSDQNQSGEDSEHVRKRQRVQYCAWFDLFSRF